ncbi:MAG TPA: hypothetical protein VEQ10_16465, partial [Vicinamibacteria bacterium]|nr:hypothetical protein [Vicinamibacteria bacterium]
LAFPRHRPSLYWTREYDATPAKAHNELLHALATEGIVGGMAWCLVATGALALGVRALREAGPERGLAASLLGGWVAFVVLAQVGFAVVATASFLAVWAGILVVLRTGTSPAALAPAVAESPWVPIASMSATAFAVGFLSDEAPFASRLGPVLSTLAAVLAAAMSQAWAASRALSEVPAIPTDTIVDRCPPEPTPRRRTRWASVGLVGVAALSWLFLVLRPLVASVAAHGSETARTPQQAVDLLATAYRFDPLRVSYLRRLGLAMLKVDRPGRDPQDRTAWLLRSREVLTEGVRLVPRDGYGWASLALAETRLAAAGALDRGQPFRSMQEALRLDPANVTFRLAGANAALELGDLTRARQFALEAARMLPDLAAARAQLGHVAAREGRVDEAIGLLREALGLQWYGQAEARHTAQANLASLLTRARSFADAARVARALVGEAPSFPPGHYQLARALEGLGASAEASVEYQVTLRLDPSHQGAREALDRAARQR